MKVDSVKIFQYRAQGNYTTYPQETDYKSSARNFDSLPMIYPVPYFTGKKIIDTNSDKNKFLKQLDEILKENIPEEEINPTEVKYKGLKLMNSLNERLINLYSEMATLMPNKTLNPQQKFNRASQIRKEVNSIKNVLDRGYFYVVRSNNYVADEKTDYLLINKFKSSVEGDNFNLKKVFQLYYQPINNIHTIKELQKKYPKIHVPQRPEDVIARKLESVVTRDFYKQLDDAFVNNDKVKAQKLISEKVMQLLNDNIKIKSEEEKNTTFAKLIKPTVKTISSRYYKLHNTGSFSFVPEYRKINKNLISENDIKLLGINYDDFVLTVLKEQYTNFKKPNEIVYNKDGKAIKVSSLKESEYKFDKIPSRIIKLIQDSESIRKSQRDYKNYTPEYFRKKLAFYAEKFGDSESLLNTIVQFDSCLFAPEDVQMLIKFLREADNVWDGEKTIQELEEFVYDYSIRPIHTERMNKIEQKKKIEAIKAENKKIATLRNIQDNFDDKIDILYENNLNYLAGICSKYKPQNLDKTQIETAKIITDILDKNIHGGKLKNKDLIETRLIRITNYLDYSIADSDNKVLNMAREYARSQNGAIDMEKAGKYILNAEFMQNYPQSLELASHKEIASKIAQNNTKEKAIEYLCKYDDYKDLTQNEKTKISNILNLFDIKDLTEKFILKTIIEEDYINTDTSSVAKLTNDGSKIAKTIIGKNAKNQIYNYYKFPKCLNYFESFEDALSQFATSRMSAGIKKIISTNANELKIKGFPDRLFAYNETYYFDEFSPTGLH